MERLIAMMAVLASGAASAQDAPPASIQGLDNFTLDRSAPVRPEIAPTPTPTPTPAPTPAAPVVVASPTPVPTRQSRPPEPIASSSPAAISPTPAATPDIVAVTPAVEATPAPNETPVPPMTVDDGWSWWWALAVLLLAALGSGVAFWWRSRGETAAEQGDAVAELETAAAAAPLEPVPAPPPPPPVAPAAPATASRSGLITSSLRAAIELDLHPIRAGVDTLRLQLAYELDIRNAGPVGSRELFVEMAMISAGTVQDEVLAVFFAASPGEPIAESDGLAAGGSARLGGEITLDRDAFDIISAGGKRMVVPLIAVRVLGPTGTVVAKAAWLVGIEREGEARMAPLRIDRNGWSEPLGRRDYPTG